MKIIIASLFLCFSIPMFSVHTENTNCINLEYPPSNPIFQGALTYKYGQQRIDKQLYIESLAKNVDSYARSKSWNQYEFEEFKRAYWKFMEALEQDRLYANDFGDIYDSKGLLSGVDEDDYWYDNKGNRITGTEYKALSERKKKKYRTFRSHTQVVNYFKKIAKEILNRRISYD